MLEMRIAKIFYKGLMAQIKDVLEIEGKRETFEQKVLIKRKYSNTIVIL